LHQGVSAVTIQVSLVHYNTGNDVDRLFEALDAIT
jgi:selenocysteine lyase/cysteine desulfurase